MVSKTIVWASISDFISSFFDRSFCVFQYIGIPVIVLFQVIERCIDTFQNFSEFLY